MGMTLKSRTPLPPFSAKRLRELAEQGITNPMSTFRPTKAATAKAKTPSKLPALPKLAVITGEFSPAVVDLILDRDMHSCARRGIGVGDCRGLDFSIQHRRARGGGGSEQVDTGLSANGIILCGSATSPHCHWEVEQRRSEDETAGYWIRQLDDGKPSDPTTVPLYHAAYGWVLLDNQGGFNRIAGVAA